MAPVELTSAGCRLAKRASGQTKTGSIALLLALMRSRFATDSHDQFIRHSIVAIIVRCLNNDYQKNNV